MKVKLIILTLCLAYTQIYARQAIHSEVDELTGEKSIYLVLGEGKPTKAMPFPYSNISSTVQLGCNKKSTWSYFYFNVIPNLTNTVLVSNGATISTRGKIGDSLESISLFQQHGGKVLHIEAGAWFVRKLKEIKPTDIMIELFWYGSGSRYFKYNTPDIDNNIKEFEVQCKALQ